MKRAITIFTYVNIALCLLCVGFVFGVRHSKEKVASDPILELPDGRYFMYKKGDSVQLFPAVVKKIELDNS